MGSTLTTAEWELISDGRDVLPRLLAVEEGWATAPEVLFSIAPTDPRERARSRRILTALGRVGVWEHMSARHQGESMSVYRVDHDAIERTIHELAVVR